MASSKSLFLQRMLILLGLAVLLISSSTALPSGRFKRRMMIRVPFMENPTPDEVQRMSQLAGGNAKRNFLPVSWAEYQFLEQ
ncbi:unnamed protein product, partial [Mesorhabditis spiculigera]